MGILDLNVLIHSDADTFKHLRKSCRVRLSPCIVENVFALMGAGCHRICMRQGRNLLKKRIGKCPAEG